MLKLITYIKHDKGQISLKIKPFYTIAKNLV